MKIKIFLIALISFMIGVLGTAYITSTRYGELMIWTEEMSNLAKKSSLERYIQLYEKDSFECLYAKLNDDLEYEKHISEYYKKQREGISGDELQEFFVQQKSRKLKATTVCKPTP
ncbi:MAG: hypothetical protein GY931_14645 [Maribacter sp.]|nr:hypothetical protein [Maribacter sp.]